jgi:hypothetical protein
MIALLCFFLALFVSPFKSKSRLEAENAALRHPLRRAIQRCGAIITTPILSGLHHRYARI